MQFLLPNAQYLISSEDFQENQLLGKIYKRKSHDKGMSKDMVFSNKMKYVGIFNFKNFYDFSFKWLKGEVGLTLIEDEYTVSFTKSS